MTLGSPRRRRGLLLGAVGALPFIAALPAHAASGDGENTLLPAALRHPGHGSVASSVVSGTGNAALHMLLGLLVVCALILALYKFLKRNAAKNDRTVRDDGWMQVVSSTPLAPSRSLHLVRVGDEVVLLASSEQSVTPVRVYTPQEAKSLGVDLSEVETRGPRTPRGGSPGFGTALVENLKRLTAR